MPKLSEEQIKANSHIPTNEIKQDLADTQKEIADFQDEKNVLMRNPRENRTRIYLLEGRIIQRQEFVAKLNQILDYRELSQPHNEKEE